MPITAFQNYLQLEKNYSQHTVKAYVDDVLSFQTFIQNQYQTNQLNQANYSMIRTWVVHLVNQNKSTLTVNRKIASLKAYCKFMLKTKQITENPLAKHKALKQPKRIQKPFSESEINKALENQQPINTFDQHRNQLIIELLYATGIRKSELINLKLQDLNLDQNLLKVVGKRNKERLIPIIPSLINPIQNYLNQRNKIQNQTKNPFLFITKKGNQLSQSLVYRVVKTSFSQVTTKHKKSPHILRHSFATHLLNEGANINAIKELLGHSSLASTQVYTNSSIAELKKVHSKTHPRNN